MWKYVSRRLRDTFERSFNHFDKRSSAGVANSQSHGNNTINTDDKKNKVYCHSCRRFSSRKCWNSFQNDDTNNKRWNFDHLNGSLISAITWDSFSNSSGAITSCMSAGSQQLVPSSACTQTQSSAVVAGWYASQLIHLKLKRNSKYRKCPSAKSLIPPLLPYLPFVNKNALISVDNIEKIIHSFTPPVHLISNEQNLENKSSSSSGNESNHSDGDLGNVLNSIENRLGLSAIENGQHKDGLNLLRSAANRKYAPALYNLGLCYELGLGVKIDEKMAMELYRSAAALEHPGALYNLGIYYGQGRGGLERDSVMATRLLRLAAIQGQEDAIRALETLQPEGRPNNDTSSWEYSCTPFVLSDDTIPTPTTLFVENVSSSQPLYGY